MIAPEHLDVLVDLDTLHGNAHHLIAWVEGVLTNVDEMCLLCPPHHLGVHLGMIELPRLE